MLKDTIYKCLSWETFLKLPLGAEPCSAVASYGLKYSCLLMSHTCSGWCPAEIPLLPHCHLLQTPWCLCHCYRAVFNAKLHSKGSASRVFSKGWKLLGCSKSFWGVHTNKSFLLISYWHDVYNNAAAISKVPASCPWFLLQGAAQIPDSCSSVPA